jgi:hypothetical protein
MDLSNFNLTGLLGEVAGVVKNRDNARFGAQTAEAQALVLREEQLRETNRQRAADERTAAQASTRQREWIIWGAGIVVVLFLIRATDRG